VSKDAQTITAKMRAMFNHGQVVVTGTMVAGSMDADAQTIDVLPTWANDDASLMIHGVLLNAVEQGSGMVLYPADGSDVMIASVEGEWVLLNASVLVKAQVTLGGSKFTITDGLIQMNDGGNGGVPISQSVAGRIKRLEQAFNNHLVTYNAHSHTISGGSTNVPSTPDTGTIAPFTQATDIENTVFKH